MSLTCRYCRRALTGLKDLCEHCGAPTPVELVKYASGTADIVEKATGTVGSVDKVLRKFLPPQLWRLVALAILILTSLVLLGNRALVACAPPTWQTPVVTALPKTLRDNATCTTIGPDTERCEISGTATLLSGGLINTKSLIFEAHLTTSAALAVTIKQWRATSTVIADGAVFAAIGRTSMIWYGDQRSGLRIDTSAFADTDHARLFLTRAGMVT